MDGERKIQMSMSRRSSIRSLSPSLVVEPPACDEEEQARVVLDKLRRIAKRSTADISLTPWQHSQLLDSVSRLYLWIHGFPGGTMSEMLLKAKGMQELVGQMFSSIAAAGELIDSIANREARSRELSIDSEGNEDSYSPDLEEEPDGRIPSSDRQLGYARILDIHLPDATENLSQAIRNIAFCTNALMEVLPVLERVTYFAEHPLSCIRGREPAMQSSDIDLAERISGVLVECLGQGNQSFRAKYSRYCAKQVGQLECSRPRDELLSSLKRNLRIPLTSPSPPAIPAQSMTKGLAPCWICGNEVEGDMSGRSWRKHVYRDLKPFICTFEGCFGSTVGYSSILEWAEHESHNHHVNQTFSCPQCQIIFSSAGTRMAHMKELCMSGTPDDQLLRVLGPPEDSLKRLCPFCSKKLFTRLFFQDKATLRSFHLHVGRHMEMIALSWIPDAPDTLIPLSISASATAKPEKPKHIEGRSRTAESRPWAKQTPYIYSPMDHLELYTFDKIDD
ncbi:hypothetical protein GJ744_006324 [Endocarpon pusillum]|uniref:C2H2-type domain-containing protein n=1 Tax=Endocarpon pusillum TaxID=364733 RepID=A0A8H7E6X7_9EURO|nr:hypothetical protein GJ744_006324 [Endocarpon pusillum]